MWHIALKRTSLISSRQLKKFVTMKILLWCVDNPKAIGTFILSLCAVITVKNVTGDNVITFEKITEYTDMINLDSITFQMIEVSHSPVMCARYCAQDVHCVAFMENTQSFECRIFDVYLNSTRLMSMEFSGWHYYGEF